MSQIINMEQIRAASAMDSARGILQARGSKGDQLSGYHSLIITNGLLATFAYSADKGDECRLIAESLVRHLAALQAAKRFPGEPLPTDLVDAIHCISVTATPALLAMMTDECMAYLNYLKRFARAMKQC